MKYRVEHVSFVPGHGISYNETIDNTDTLLTAAELSEYYGDYCGEHDWLQQVAENNEIVSTTERERNMKYFIADKYGNCLADNIDAPSQTMAEDILTSRYNREEIDRDEIEILPYDDEDYVI